MHNYADRYDRGEKRRFLHCDKFNKISKIIYNSYPKLNLHREDINDKTLSMPSSIRVRIMWEHSCFTLARI